MDLIPRHLSARVASTLRTSRVINLIGPRDLRRCFAPCRYGRADLSNDRASAVAAEAEDARRAQGELDRAGSFVEIDVGGENARLQVGRRRRARAGSSAAASDWPTGQPQRRPD